MAREFALTVHPRGVLQRHEEEAFSPYEGVFKIEPGSQGCDPTKEQYFYFSNKEALGIRPIILRATRASFTQLAQTSCASASITSFKEASSFTDLQGTPLLESIGQNRPASI